MLSTTISFWFCLFLVETIIFTVFRYLNLFRGFTISYVCIVMILFLLNNANLIIFSFVFKGFSFFEPVGLSGFWCALDSFAIILQIVLLGLQSRLEHLQLVYKIWLLLLNQ